MKTLLISTIVYCSLLVGCAHKPVIAKDCVKAEGSNLFVCKKH